MLVLSNGNEITTFRDVLANSTPEDEKSTIVLNEDLKDNISIDIQEKLRKRPFPSRFFITSTRFPKEDNDEEYDGCFLRTHFSDCADHESHLNTIRDYVWGVSTLSPNAAQANLSALVSSFIRMDETEYYSVASTIASALSERAENTIFEDKDFMNGETSIEIVRCRFVIFMSTVFDSVTRNRFLHKNGGLNIYSLISCSLYSDSVSAAPLHKNWKISILIAPFFTFLLQMSLTTYVLLEVIEITKDGYDIREQMIFLAIVASVYSSVIAMKGIRNTFEINRFYETRDLLWFMDLCANVVTPTMGIVLGFFLIAFQDSYIDGVLNTAALLFISDIDDQFPNLLNLRCESITHNYIVQRAIQKAKAANILLMNSTTSSALIHKLFEGENFTSSFVPRDSLKIVGIKSLLNLLDNTYAGDIQYSDIIATNMPERGGDISRYEFFGPTDMTNFTTLDIIQPECLMSEISWIYKEAQLTKQTLENKDQRDKGYSEPKISIISGHIAYLRMVSLMDGKEIIFEDKTLSYEIDKQNFDGCVRGVYIITDFTKTKSINRLRICGSKTSKDFIRAMEYYSLWEISPLAQRLLQSRRGIHTF